MLITLCKPQLRTERAPQHSSGHRSERSHRQRSEIVARVYLSSQFQLWAEAASLADGDCQISANRLFCTENAIACQPTSEYFRQLGNVAHHRIHVLAGIWRSSQVARLHNARLHDRGRRTSISRAQARSQRRQRLPEKCRQCTYTVLFFVWNTY